MQDRQVKHYRDMSREELIELVGSMGWMALNLAQDLSMIETLKVQYRKNAYHRATQAAYELTHAWDMEYKEGNMEIAFFGKDGLEVTTGDISQLADGSLAIAPVEECDEEIDYNDFDHLYMELDNGIPVMEEIEESKKSMRYIQDILNNHTGKEHVDIKVKTLRKAIWPFDYILDVAKASRKMLDMIDKDAWQPKSISIKD